MNSKLISLVLILLSFSLALTAQDKKQIQAKTKQSLPIHKVVMQLSSGDTLEHKGLLNNLKNLNEGWADKVMIEVVVHGPGIDLVTKGRSTQEKNIQNMISKGVRFVVCRNTMKQKNITEDQILSNVGFVPMGVGEIILKQEQGWSYLKAGF